MIPGKRSIGCKKVCLLASSGPISFPVPALGNRLGAPLSSLYLFVALFDQQIIVEHHLGRCTLCLKHRCHPCCVDNVLLIHIVDRQLKLFSFMGEIQHVFQIQWLGLRKLPILFAGNTLWKSYKKDIGFVFIIDHNWCILASTLINKMKGTQMIVRYPVTKCIINSILGNSLFKCVFSNRLYGPSDHGLYVQVRSIFAHTQTG